MVELLIVVILLCIAAIVFQYISAKKKIKLLEEKFIELKKQFDELKEKEISKKDLQFLEFTVDMYIKYSKDLNIHSKDQHEYIVGELERIRNKYLINVS